MKSYEPKYFGSILGLPQIVTPSKLHSQRPLCTVKTDHTPVGQLAYESRISKRQEHVPVIATFAGAKGILSSLDLRQMYLIIGLLTWFHECRQRCDACEACSAGPGEVEQANLCSHRQGVLLPRDQWVGQWFCPATKAHLSSLRP